MKSSLSRRVFWAMLSVGLLNAVITLVTTEVVYEDIEDTNLTIGLAEERAFFENSLDPKRTEHWQTALLTAFYVPDTEADIALPHLFRDRPVPFAAEVDLDDETYLISISRTRDNRGVIYLAQDITVMEHREDLMQEIGFVLFMGAMTLLSLILARFGSQRVIDPLKKLAGQIRELRPGQPMHPVEVNSTDQELKDIAHVLNDLLDALNAHLQREKALISLASHELRTPIAVISGALDVIENRGTFGQDNQKTISRIRYATQKMQADLDALLHLAHRPAQPGTDRVDLEESVLAVINELEASNEQYLNRISLERPHSGQAVIADPALVRMLIRNLIQNALRHTRGRVTVSLDDEQLRVMDDGPGLPASIRQRLRDQTSASPVPEDGLGLFIVKLICDRLGWHLQTEERAESGSGIWVLFSEGKSVNTSDQSSQS